MTKSRLEAQTHGIAQILSVAYGLDTRSAIALHQDHETYPRSADGLARTGGRPVWIPVGAGTASKRNGRAGDLDRGEGKRDGRDDYGRWTAAGPHTWRARRSAAHFRRLQRSEAGDRCDDRQP